VYALVYVTVAITVLSGADYFFGVQDVASSQVRRLVWTAEAWPVAISRRISPSVPNRSATTLC